MVTGLDKLEEQLRTLIEEHAVRLLGGAGSDRALAERLLAALQADAPESFEGHVPLPDVFALNVNPRYAQEIRANQAFLDGLSAALLKAAEAKGLHFDEAPGITVFPDDAVAEGDFAITALRATPSADTHDVLPAEAQPEPGSAESQVPPRAFLIVGGSTIFPLELDVVNVGRKLSNNLVVDDPRVSRNHCQLRAVKGQYLLFDLNSSGGSFVNGKRITQMTLQPGDVISLAGVPIVYGQDVIRSVGETREYLPPRTGSDDISTTSLDINQQQGS